MDRIRRSTRVCSYSRQRVVNLAMLKSSHRRQTVESWQCHNLATLARSYSRQKVVLAAML